MPNQQVFIAVDSFIAVSWVRLTVLKDLILEPIFPFAFRSVVTGLRVVIKIIDLRDRAPDTAEFSCSSSELSNAVVRASYRTRRGRLGHCCSGILSVKLAAVREQPKGISPAPSFSVGVVAKTSRPYFLNLYAGNRKLTLVVVDVMHLENAYFVAWNIADIDCLLLGVRACAPFRFLLDGITLLR